MGFHQDEVGDWVADLECGHGQHVRHRPPWSERPWVLSVAGRQKQLGMTLDCRLCESAASGFEIWRDPVLVTWSGLLLDSFRRWTGRELIPRSGTAPEEARALFHAPCVVVSHGTEPDPVLNYGNQRALDLWETAWSEFVRTPSRVTAEPPDQAERHRMLERTTANGYIEDYRGVRVSLRGRRFVVEQAVIWNVIGEDGRRCGQAATFSQWRLL